MWFERNIAFWQPGQDPRFPDHYGCMASCEYSDLVAVFLSTSMTTLLHWICQCPPSDLGRVEVEKKNLIGEHSPCPPLGQKEKAHQGAIEVASACNNIQSARRESPHCVNGLWQRPRPTLLDCTKQNTASKRRDRTL